MLPRRLRKRHHRIPMARRWAPAIVDYFPDLEAEFRQQLEELRKYAKEQMRLKELDDGPS